MANLVLYRKYRPQKFSDVVGQEHITRTISNAIAMGEIAHAYLFAGPRGTGKTTLARLLAKSLNCEKRKPDEPHSAKASRGEYEPCLKCLSCEEVAKGISPDIIEIDAASNRGIDEIRLLKEAVRFAPTRGEYKIYIIDEVHMLTKEAFNALLKTLEEPPSHVIFVMATTEINKVLPTIISRSQRFDFRRLRHSEIKERLAHITKCEGKKLDPKIFDMIAARADGCARDAENLLGQILVVGEGLSLDDIRSLLGLTDIQAISEFIGHLAVGSRKDALAHLSALSERGVDHEEFVRSLLGYIRWMMYLKVDDKLSDIVGREMCAEDLAIIKAMAQKFDMPKLKLASRLFLEALQNIKYSPIPELPIELAAVELLEG